MKQALAMVETKGFVAAMEAADAALKSASVELLGWKKAGGGLVAIFFTGDVASAKAALESPWTPPPKWARWSPPPS